MLSITLKYHKESRGDREVFIPERLPHGTSPYWRDNLQEWRKLRAYREDIRNGKTDPEVVIQVNAESWCKAYGIEGDAEKRFLATNSGLKKVQSKAPDTKKDFDLSDKSTSKKE